MPQLLIQPSGGLKAQVHFGDTIQNLVSLDSCAGLVPQSVLTELKTLFPAGECAMWGLVPGANDANLPKWEKIAPGDVVVFTGKKRLFSVGTVASKFHSPGLAKKLWGLDDNSATWEYMYTLTDVVETDIPYSVFNELLGDNPNNNHMGFRIVDDVKAAAFVGYLGTHAAIAQPSVEQVVVAIRQLEFEDVQVIIDEWELIGREEFLRLHSLSSAFKYLLVWGDKTYDAKAVAVQAIRTKHPELAHLRSNAFDGDASTIAKPLRTAGWEVVDKRDIDRGIEEEQHDRELQDRVNIGPAEKSQLRTARIGQGKFKHNVLLRESKCRITGISDPLHLRASHIKPWCKSNDIEKLDGNNGLMLAPHIDHLFDKGWITFQGNGDVLLSPQCAPVIFNAFGIVPNMNVGSFTPEQDAYLEYHRDSLFKK